MIIEVRAKNCFSFLDEINFSLKADMRNKRFATNVHQENSFNVLKTVGIYGQNNAGKTCLIKCIRAIKNIILNKPPLLIKNLFTKNEICELGITFLYLGKKYSYDVKFNADERNFIYEKFSEITKDKYGNESVDVWLEIDVPINKYDCRDKKLQETIPLMSHNNLLYYVIDTSKFEFLENMKNILTGFAEKIDIINMNNIPMEHTIQLMKNKGGIQEKIVNFIKNADLYMDNFEYVDMDKIKVEVESENQQIDEAVLNEKQHIMDQVRLVSTYKGIPVPSIIFDSTGTKKIAALAGYIIEALEKGRILVIDELDSSIHFKLTRAIVAMFNNELNKSSQMIFTVHDINLMDCKRLFRKEQIWFIHKDDDGVYVYSLADFTAEDGIRDTTDIMEKYRKGVLGALPDPELINTLLDIKGNKNSDSEEKEDDNE